MTGITMGTMALIVVLSVFNGFEQVVVSLLGTFNPDIEIRATQGKTFNLQHFPIGKVGSLSNLDAYASVIEENALVRYRDRQHIVTLKGVDDTYLEATPLDSMLVDGSLILRDGDVDYAIVGAGIAWYLELTPRDFLTPLEMYVPRRTGMSVVNPLEAFNREIAYPSGVFSIQQEFDTRYVLVPLRTMQRLLDYQDERTALEIRLKGGNASRIAEELQASLGPDYLVRDRFQQQETLYRIMRSEKWAIFLILTFIILIAAFNMIGSVSMLVIDKRKDIAVLWSMGASLGMIQKIFLHQGILLTAAGTLLGLALGALVCWLQQHFGLIQLQGVDGSFVISAYPVMMQWQDFVYVLLTVMIIGLAASVLPARRIQPDDNRRHYLTR